MSQTASSERRRPRHLLDPDNPRPQPVRGAMSLSTVQMWVLSTLSVSTVLHFALGLVASAVWLADGRPDAQIGLSILAGVTGVLAVALGFAVHRKPVLNGWLSLGLLPLPLGLYFSFWA